MFVAVIEEDVHHVLLIGSLFVTQFAGLAVGVLLDGVEHLLAAADLENPVNLVERLLVQTAQRTRAVTHVDRRELTVNLLVVIVNPLPHGSLFGVQFGFDEPRNDAVTRAEDVLADDTLERQLLTGLLAKTTYPTDEKGVLLYADPEADEAVAGYLNADEGVLELRHHALGLKTLDLFRRDPTGLWDSLQSTDTLNVADFLQVDSSAGEDYCRICFDAEADKIYLVSAPEVDYIDATGVVKIREYDRKALAAKDYTVPNNTGVDLQSFISENRGTPLNGTVYGGSLYMVQDQAEQIYRFPLADPTDVQAVTMHGDDMAYLSDAHDGRLYCYYRTRAVVLNTGKNELFSCEAAGYDNTTSGFSTTAPVLGEPLTPLRRYYGDSRIRTERVLRANYLATINDLPKSVEKTADKTMKVIYTLRRGG